MACSDLCIISFSIDGLCLLHSDINKTLQYLLTHTTTNCSQLQSLSTLLPSLLYSYISGLHHTTLNSNYLYQYRSVFTEYCLDKLNVKQCTRVPSKGGGGTLNNRLKSCEELRQLLTRLGVKYIGTCT